MRGVLGILVCVLALGCAAVPARRFTAAPTGELGNAARTGGYFTREAAVAELRRRGAEGAAELGALVRDGVRLDHDTLVLVTQHGDDATNAAVVRLLVEELRVSPLWHQAKVLQTLRRVPPSTPGIADPLSGLFASPDPRVRLRAAWVLGRTPYRGPDALLCRHLAEQSEDSIQMLEYVLDQHLQLRPKICGLGSPLPDADDLAAAAELLRPALQAEYVGLRGLGLSAMVVSGDSHAAEHLAEALRSPSSQLVLEALRLVVWLTSITFEKDRPALQRRFDPGVKALRNHADPRVRGWAAVAFGELNDLLPPPSITLQYLESEDHELRKRCLGLLRASDLDAAAIPALLEALKRSDRDSRWVLMELIYGIGPAAAEPLRAALPDIRNPNARAHAARLLAFWDRVAAEHR